MYKKLLIGYLSFLIITDFGEAPGKTTEYTEKRRMFRMLRNISSDRPGAGKRKPVAKPPETARTGR
ncbi:Uncharacterized protein dnm_067130 [Desulfonema magnum]|uniref:Uncharacterized protein n=1 Tax=Desulfonema magnum TaxID=45655 RepID=A0A975BS07_9BACT|nr:Uncharacterized protein dnm_067130 [Desulfonema magnum]